jgi:hypothetical protein
MDYGGGEGVTSWSYTVEIGGYGTVERSVDVDAGTITMTDADDGSVIAEYDSEGWITYQHPYAGTQVPVLTGWVGSIVSSVLGQVQPIIDAAIAPILSQMRDITRLLSATMKEVQGFVFDQVQAVTIATVSAYKELQKYFDLAIGKVTGALQDLYKTVSGWISSAVQAASAFLQQAIAKVQETLQAADNALRGAIDGLWAWVLQRVGDLVSEVQKLWAMLQDIVRAAREEAEKTAAAIADLEASLQAWVEEHVVEILLRALDAAAVSL